MARAVIGLDLSDTSWKSVVISRGARDTIQIHGYASFPALPFTPQQFLTQTDLSLDPALAEWASKIHENLAALAAEASDYIVGVPQDLFALRLLDLPFTQLGKIAQVLPFEVEQTLLFDADDQVFDFFPLAQMNGTTKVLSASLRKVHLGNLLERLKLMQIDPMVVAPTALAFHHLLRLSAPAAAETQRIVFVDIGEQQTQISAVEGKRTIFALTLNHGRCPRPVAPPPESAPATEPPAPAPVVQVEAEAETGLPERLMGPLLQALERSLHYLEGFVPAVAPGEGACPLPVKKILLLGEGASLPGLAEHITERLGVETVPFRIRDEVIAQAPELTPELHPLLAPALALAMQQVLPDSRPGLNFRKGLFSFRPERQELIRKAIFPGILTAVLLLSLLFRVVVSGNAEKRQAQALRMEMEQIFRANFPSLPLRDPAAQLQQMLVEAKAKQLKYTDLATPSALECLASISSVIPPTLSVNIRNFDYKTDQITIYGNADNYENANELAKLLKQIPLFTKVDMENSQKITQGDVETIQFTIKINLKKEAAP